jgi:hypothetical protein
MGKRRRGTTRDLAPALHTRWHLKRGIVRADCPICTPGFIPVPRVSQPCECGCGEITGLGRRFVLFHAFRPLGNKRGRIDKILAHEKHVEACVVQADCKRCVADQKAKRKLELEQQRKEEKARRIAKRKARKPKPVRVVFPNEGLETMAELLREAPIPATATAVESFTGATDDDVSWLD